jgi:hypothetical protein
MLFNVNQLLEDYIETSNLTAKESFDYLVANRRDIVKQMGINVFKQMALNYRTYFHASQRERIYRDFEKYVMNKTEQHTSDLAIAYNIIKYVGVDKDREKILVNYIFDRIKDTHFSRYGTLNLNPIKRGLVLSTMEDHILKKKK